MRLKMEMMNSSLQSIEVVLSSVLFCTTRVLHPFDHEDVPCAKEFVSRKLKL